MSATDSSNPVLVEVTRGKHVECRHRGACAVVSATGELVHAWGDVGQLVYPRSALKPIQALPLIETGAADYFGLGSEEIALACASHNSEPMHVDRVNKWLSDIGLDVDDLECGLCESISLDVTKAMSRESDAFTRAHNNCSGKHTGFLTTAVHLGEPTRNYIQPDHPVQRRVTAVIEDMAETSLVHVPCSSDGCGIPVFAFPLKALALATAKMTSSSLGRVRSAAAKKTLDAMASHPELVAGTGRFDTRLMQACKGSILTKGGAEGVHIAAIPDKGWGVALKIDDGAIRASELTMGCVLDGLDLITEEARALVGDLIEQPVNTTRGERVGELRRGPGLSF